MILPPAAPVQTAGLTEEAILDRLVAELVGGEVADEGAQVKSEEATGGSSADQGVRPTDSPEIKAEASASAEAPVEMMAGVAVLEAEEEAVEAQVEIEPAEPEPEPAISAGVVEAPQSHWLLSLYTPAAGDTVDWRRGSYAVLTRGGRVESPAGSGGPKKQVQMIAEGSVLTAASEPRGAVADVGPEGFPHPVYRAGFALAIPLPEVR
jgi:hypothetical protein